MQADLTQAHDLERALGGLLSGAQFGRELAWAVRAPSFSDPEFLSGLSIISRSGLRGRDAGVAPLYVRSRRWSSRSIIRSLIRFAGGRNRPCQSVRRARQESAHAARLAVDCRPPLNR